MDKKFVRLILFIPILVLLMITNIYQDPANLFQDMQFTVLWEMNWKEL